MANPSKQKGTAAETAVVRYLLEHGVIAARVPLAGAADIGDVHALNGRIVIEVKSRKAHPSPAQIAAWMAETDREAGHVLACEVGVLVVKRPGSGPANAGDWTVHMHAEDFVLLSGSVANYLDDDTAAALVTMSLASFTALLRGWAK